MLDAIEFAAVVASAVYGILRAIRKGFDVVGITAVAFAVAFGGGTLRDLFLDRHPLFWIANDHYVVIVFALSVLGAVIPRHVPRVERMLTIPDALGLGLFSIVGAGFAIESQTSLFVAAILGVVTGTFGGVIGDIVCNEVPSLFRQSPLYATCAFAGAWTYLLLGLLPVPAAVPEGVGIAVTVALRWAALHWNLQLPGSHLDEGAAP